MRDKSFDEIKAQCLKEKKLYEDPDFPALDSSIFYSRSPPRPFVWQRPTVSCFAVKFTQKLMRMCTIQDFNSYFASVFTSENISALPFVTDMFCGAAEDKCHDVLFSQDDVLRALSNQREDKAAGPDDLSPRFLFHIKDQLSCLLFLIFRKSLDEGAVPTDWKVSNVSPIYKKGDRSHAENYRPVSLTSVICKLFESII